MFFPEQKAKALGTPKILPANEDQNFRARCIAGLYFGISIFLKLALAESANAGSSAFESGDGDDSGQDYRYMSQDRAENAGSNSRRLCVALATSRLASYLSKSDWLIDPCTCFHLKSFLACVVHDA